MAMQARPTRSDEHGGAWRRAASTALAIALLTAACASGSAIPEGSSAAYTRIETNSGAYELEINKDRTPTRHIVAGSPAAAWAALPAAYSALGIEGGVVSVAHRIFGQPARRPVPRTIADQRLSQFLSCGYGVAGSKADTYDVRLAMVTQIDSTAEGTTVLTWLDAAAKPRDVSSGFVQCGTNGKLEQTLVDSLQARLGAGG